MGTRGEGELQVSSTVPSSRCVRLHNASLPSLSHRDCREHVGLIKLPDHISISIYPPTSILTPTPPSTHTPSPPTPQ